MEGDISFLPESDFIAYLATFLYQSAHFFSLDSMKCHIGHESSTFLHPYCQCLKWDGCVSVCRWGIRARSKQNRSER